PLASADSAGARSAGNQKGDPPLPAPLPARFSAVLVDPLPMPSLEAIGLFDELAAKETTAASQAVRAHRSHRYALLWLWDEGENVARASRSLSRERPAPAAVGAVREPPLRQDARVTAGETPAPQVDPAPVAGSAATGARGHGQDARVTAGETPAPQVDPAPVAGSAATGGRGHGQDARATAGETPAPQADPAPGLEALLAVQG